MPDAGTATALLAGLLTALFAWAGLELAVGWLTHGASVDTDTEGRAL